MENIFDIATWFLLKEAMTHKKVQKLCYYSQAWYKTLHNKKLINEKFEAWIHGPVSPILYSKYSKYGWNPIELKTELENESISIDSPINKFLENVWATYGHLDGQQLEALTHNESPWILARGGLSQWARSNKVITLKSMKDYYGSLYRESQGD